MAMMASSSFPAVLLALVAPLMAAAVAWVWEYVVVRLVWRPHAVGKQLREQGIRGPPYRFLNGCNDDVRAMKEEGDGLVLQDLHDHNYLPRIAPHYLRWREQYGEPFLYWLGAKPRVCIFDHELARQILSSKSGHFEKNDPPPTLVDLVGKGLALLDGPDWVRHHRVIKPAFAMDKLKMMTATMVACAETMVKELESEASRSKGGEIEVEFSKRFRELTADVISHTAFGSSYETGKQVFHTQHELMAINMASLLDVQIPGSKYLPTERNRRKWKLEKQLRSSLLQIIQPRLASTTSTGGGGGGGGGGYGNDLLGLMLESCANTAAEKGGQGLLALSMSVDEIIHECKMFFFAGHDTTSLLLTWAVFLLGVYPEWQERLRAEVVREIGIGPSQSPSPPSADDLSRLKEMTMVLLETLRLYCPALFMQRKTVAETTTVGPAATRLLRGVAVVIPIPVMQREASVWGDDAGEFNPLRFENGASRAAGLPHAFLAFSIGPRSCIGQNFAMMEAKATLAAMLARFSFAVSPSYVHAPVDLFTLKPKFGLPVILRRLDRPDARRQLHTDV